MPTGPYQMQVEQQIHYADPVKYQYLVDDDFSTDKNDVEIGAYNNEANNVTCNNDDNYSILMNVVDACSERFLSLEQVLRGDLEGDLQYQEVPQVETLLAPAKVSPVLKGNVPPVEAEVRATSPVSDRVWLAVKSSPDVGLLLRIPLLRRISVVVLLVGVYIRNAPSILCSLTHPLLLGFLMVTTRK
ncbi:unnamed protein product [Lactuca saligna]|uniref:Uncharacterized protein n=1 Tax=Lactuca saligna TaxID=75948 RepID=A0AA35ZYN7_LACSI|nr:unnamed protein product [Lactuca saligna]